MDARVVRCTKLDQVFGHFVQGRDIGHAHDAEANPLAAMWLGFRMIFMQTQTSITHEAGKLGALFRLSQGLSLIHI